MSLSKFSLSNDAAFQKKRDVLIGERRFYLNKSNSKYISIALNYNLNFTPSIIISGNKNDSVVFSEEQFEHFLSFQGVITHSLYKNEDETSMDCDQFSLDFKKISNQLILKIWKDNSSVFLAYDTICSLWDLLPLIRYVVDLLKRQEFPSYYRVIQHSIQGGDLKTQALKLLAPTQFLGSNNICLCLEFISLYPEVFNEDNTKVQL